MGRPRKHFAAVGSEEVLANPEEAGTRAVLCFAIDRIITERKLTQTEAARVMGIHQSAVSLLRGYRLNKFSVERLMRLLTAMGQDVVIEIRPRGVKKGAGRVRVVGATEGVGLGEEAGKCEAERRAPDSGCSSSACG